jgi:succinoglycan biosynthesis protein ExoH
LADSQVSQAISFARIGLIMGLVFLHYGAYPNSTVSPFDGMNPVAHQSATFVSSALLFFFFSAVPLLSTVSGWLFFKFGRHEATPALRQRITRRVSSLYLPLIFWNGLYLWLAVFLLGFWPDSPLLDQLNIRLLDAGLSEYANAVFAITHHPIGFQFWFVRDLLVTVLVSPLLWALLRYAPYAGMAALGAAWLAGHDLGIFFRADVVFFFYLGGFLRLRKMPLEIGPRATTVLLALYIVLVALRAMAPLAIDMTPDRPALLEAATRAMRLLGVLACWGACLRFSALPWGRTVAHYGGLSFFLFATHFPLVVAIKYALWPLLPAQTDMWMVVHYVSSVSLTVAIGLSAGLVLARIAPDTFALMNGGRLVPLPPRRPQPGSIASST